MKETICSFGKCRDVSIIVEGRVNYNRLIFLVIADLGGVNAYNYDIE